LTIKSTSHTRLPASAFRLPPSIDPADSFGGD